MSPPDESHANSVQDPELRASFVRLYRTRENHQWAEPASPPSDPPLPAKIIQFPLFPVVVKYVGDTFLELSYEKQSAHPDKKGSPVPPEGPQRKCLSAGRVESVAV
jgi:hypothetical protein